MENWSAVDLYYASQSGHELTSSAARKIITKRWPKKEDFKKQLKLDRNLMQ